MLERTLALLLIVLMLLPPQYAWAADESVAPGHRGEVNTPESVSAGEVDQQSFTGAAGTSVPIEVPLGTGGLTPKVALSYSNQSTADSWVGYGWDLSFSQISRSQKKGPPTYTAADTFTLDGVELVPFGDPFTTDGKTRVPYETRQRSFRLIHHAYTSAANAQKGWWEVHDKNGVISRYTQLDGPDADNIHTWHITEQEDLSGNVIKYAYFVQDGIVYPNTVTYTLRREGDGSLSLLPKSRVVTFVRADRPDQPLDYSHGHARKLVKRLDRIDVSVGGTLLRRYKLNYVESADTYRSLLASVALYGTDADAATPTAPFITSFSYSTNNGTLAWSHSTEEASAWTSEWPSDVRFVGETDGKKRDGGVRLGDVNGDGLLDIVKAKATAPAGSTCGNIQLTPSSGVYLAKRDEPGWHPKDTATWTLPTWSETCGGSTRTRAAQFAITRDGKDFGSGLTLADLNGDGRADLFGMAGDSNIATGNSATEQDFENKWCVSTNTGFQCLSGAPGSSSYYVDGTSYTGRLNRYLREIDLPFDAQCEPTDSDFGRRAWSGNTRLADLTGDGLPELVVRGREKFQSRTLTRAQTASACTNNQNHRIAVLSYIVDNTTTPGGTGVSFEAPTLRTTGAGETFEYPSQTFKFSDDFLPCDPTASGSASMCSEDTLFTQAWLARDPDLDGSSNYNVIANQDWGIELVDINGDGLTDHVASRLVPPDGNPNGEPILKKRTYLNHGARNLVEHAEWEMPGYLVEHKPPAELDIPNGEFDGLVDHHGTSVDSGWRFGDLNGDGRIDLVRAQTGTPVRVELNDGDAVAQTDDDDAWRNVTSATTFPPDFTNGDGEDLGARLADVDGDGMTDIVRANENGPTVFLHQGEVPDLLTRIQNPLGGVTHLEYSPSTKFIPAANPALPMVLQVLTRRIVDPNADGDGNKATGVVQETTYTYEGGRYVASEREFRGFEWVHEHDAVRGRKISTQFAQTAARSGLPLRREVRKLPGDTACLNVTEYEYTPVAASPPYTILPRTEVRKEYEGNTCVGGLHRRSAVSYAYDTDNPAPPEYGNVISRTELGTVNVSNVPTEPTYARRTSYEYATAPSNTYGVGLVSRTTLYSGHPGFGTVVRDTTFQYLDTDARGKPSHVTKVLEDSAQNQLVEYDYDAFGNVQTEWDARGNPTNYGYDPDYHTFVTSKTLPNTDPVLSPALSTTTSYTSAQCTTPLPAGAGLPHAVTGPNGELSLTCYDRFGRVVLEAVKDGSATLSKTRTAYPSTISTTRFEDLNAAGTTSRNTVSTSDGLGRPTLVQVEGPGSIFYTETTYDGAGRVATVEGPQRWLDPALITSYQYDALDRRIQTTLPGARVQQTIYSNSDIGRVTTRNAQNEEQPRWIDVFGNLRKVGEILGGTTYYTNYAYNVAGDLLTVTDSLNHVTTIGYDRAGRKTSLDDPDMGLAGYGYDKNDNLTSRTFPGGSETTQYDALNRPKTRHLSGTLEAEWFYDTAANGRGLLRSRTDGKGSLAGSGTYEVLSYDKLGRPLTERQTPDGSTQVHEFVNTYDLLGNPVTREFPNDWKLRWTYDVNGYLSSIGRDGTSTQYATGIHWDARGRLEHWNAGNGIENTITFDPATARLQSITASQGTTKLEERGYYHSPDDQVAIIWDLVGGSNSQTFGYDDLNRLASSGGPYGPSQAGESVNFTYDRLGNMTCSGTNAAGACPLKNTMQYTNSRPHAASKIGGLTPSYNGTGSLTSLGSRSYTYDLLDRLATATEDGNVVSEFAYDAAGRRAKNVDKSRPQHRTHHYLSADFEWNETLELGSIHLSLGGKLIATIVEPHDPSPAWVPPASDLPPFDPRPIGAAAGVVALLLLLQLAALRRRGIPIARPLVAGATAWSFALFIAMPTGSAPTDGDVTEDGKLDAGDLLLMERFALGLTADSTDLLHGDIAPLEGAPENPSDINVADVVLLSRALQGEDVDGDGLFTYVEVVLGASPFLADSDFDGVRDDLELAGGSDPACHSAADSDCDGVSDTTEDASGRDRYDPDTDGDGLKDNTDPLPRSGVRYYHADHLNSPMLVTGSAGIVVARFTYTPYGKTVPAKAPVQGKMTFGFTSQRFESAIGIYDYGARWYDAAVGRFLQPDPVVPDPGSPQALNRYAYALNNPANLIDPSGNLPIVVDSLASPAIGGSDPGTIGYTPNGSYYSSNYDYYYGYDSYYGYNSYFGDGPSPYGGTFPYRSLYYDYADGYADSFHNNFLSQTNLTREIQMNAYEGYNNLVADINRFRWANPDTAIPLSGPRMDTYADYYIKTTGDLRSSNAFSYNYGMISNADTDFFRPWGGETFRVSGLGVLNGLHGGSDINYFMQGVRTAAGGGSLYWMDFRISAWNLFDRSQMPAAMMWARYGYDRYNWYHHQTGGR